MGDGYDMNKNYYDLYIQSVIDLAQTLVIKSEYNALSLNNRLRELYGDSAVNQDDPRTWKYYLNLSGEYHSKDTPMAVMSLDTLTLIPFTKASLAIHTATKEAYRYGTRYYRELVFQFPDNEDLIKGILYPVDINKAIAAPDLKVLTYPKFLVEENELSLITKIDDWIKYFSARWNNKQFVLSDTHYMASFLGIMYLQLIPLIINLRLKACKTEEAHSYHVREYLASHGMLDVYLSQLTKKQSLFLYRNICYIERNSGKREIFDWLVQKILTDRNIPLDQYEMNHDNTLLLNRYSPTPVFKKEPINYTGINQYFTTNGLLFKEDPLAPGNPEYRSLHASQINDLFENSKSSSLATKVLESSIVDLSFTDLITYHDVALNHWFSWSQSGKLNAYLQATNPQNGEKYTIHVKDAAIYFLYAFTQSLGVNLSSIPEIVATRILIEPLVSVEQLEQFRDSRYIPPEYPGIVKSFIPAIPNQISSIGNFQTTAHALHIGALKQLHFVAAQEHHTTRGYTYGMVLRMFKDQVITPEASQSFTSWMALKNIPFRDFTTKDWDFVYRNLFQEVTGESFSSTEELEALQKTMVKLLQQLSSYSIQFITEINKKSVKAINWSAIRVGDIKNYGNSYYRIYISIINILKQKFTGYSRYLLPIKDLIKRFSIQLAPFKVGPIVPDVKVRDLDIYSNLFIPIGDTNIDNRWFPEGHLNFKEAHFPLFSAFFAMTAEQKKKVFDTFTTCFKPINIPTKADITRFLLSSNLNGFSPWKIKDPYLQAFNYQYVPTKTSLLKPSFFRIILNGLENTFGSVDSHSNFNLNNGSTTVTSFEFTGGAPIDVSNNTIKYSGNYTYVPEFEPQLPNDPEMVVLGLLKNTVTTKEIQVNDFNKEFILDNNQNNFNATVILPKTVNSFVSAIAAINKIFDMQAILSFTSNITENIIDGAYNSYGYKIAKRYRNSYREYILPELKAVSSEQALLGLYNVQFNVTGKRYRNSYVTGILNQIPHKDYRVILNTPIGAIKGQAILPPTKVTTFRWGVNNIQRFTFKIIIP